MNVQAQGGAQPKDTQGASIPVAAKIQMRDASSTPKESPLAVSSSVLELKPPTNAVMMIIKAVTNDINFGDNSTLDGTANNGFMTLTAGDSLPVPVANGNSVHVVRTSADGSLHFYYELL